MNRTAPISQVINFEIILSSFLSTLHERLKTLPRDEVTWSVSFFPVDSFKAASSRSFVRLRGFASIHRVLEPSSHILVSPIKTPSPLAVTDPHREANAHPWTRVLGGPRSEHFMQTRKRTLRARPACRAAWCLPGSRTWQHPQLCSVCWPHGIGYGAVRPVCALSHSRPTTAQKAAVQT